MKFRLIKESLQDLCKLDYNQSMVFNNCWLTDNPYDVKNYILNKTQNCLRIVYDPIKNIYMFMDGEYGVHPFIYYQAVLSGYYIDENIYPKDVNIDKCSQNQKVEKICKRLLFSMFFRDIEEGIYQMTNDNGYDKFLIYNFGVIGFLDDFGMGDTELIKILGEPKEIKCVE